MVNKLSDPPADSSDSSSDSRDPALTKSFYGLDSWLVLGPLI